MASPWSKESQSTHGFKKNGEQGSSLQFNIDPGNDLQIVDRELE